MPESKIVIAEMTNVSKASFDVVKPAVTANVVLKRTIALPDNTSFITKFDKTTFIPVARPAKTIIVDQDPDPGEFVPAGTPINITLTVKGVIPPGSFKGIEAVLATKYANIGALEVDLDKDEAKNVKAVLDKNADYKGLTTGEKEAVDQFVRTTFGERAADTEEKKAKVYGDVKFLYQL